MAYCPSCGVEVTTNKCPLCSYKIKQSLKEKSIKEAVTPKKNRIKLTKKEKMVIYDVSTWFFAILVSSICITSDLLFDSKISWSIIPLLPITAFAVITTISINVKGFLKVISIFLVVILLLFALDFIIPGSNSSIGISVPTVVVSSLLALIVVILFKRSKRRGANIAGYIILAITLILICIEITIDFSLGLEIKLSWSLITTVTLIPISLFLLYIHYSLSKRIDLNKIFHT